MKRIAGLPAAEYHRQWREKDRERKRAQRVTNRQHQAARQLAKAFRPQRSHVRRDP